MKAIVTIVSDNGTIVQENITLPMQRKPGYSEEGYEVYADYSLHIEYSVLEDSLKALGESPV